MFGSACASAVQCGGLTCLTPSSGALDGGGPAKGLCTAACASDFDCQGLGSNAVCLEYSTGVGFCFEGCSFGNPGNTFLPSKCHGRPEMACSPLSDGVSLVGQACLPQCNSDADCGTLHCDPKSGLCRATPATGKDLGAECVQQDGGPGECKGNCTGIVNPGSSVPFTYTCTERCTLGAPAQCGWDGTSQAPGFCLFSSTLISTPGIGDQGSCAQLCSCNADCKNPSFVCRAFNDPNFEATLGQKGYCGSSSIQGGGVDPGIPVCN